LTHRLCRLPHKKRSRPRVLQEMRRTTSAGHQQRSISLKLSPTLLLLVMIQSPSLQCSLCFQRFPIVEEERELFPLDVGLCHRENLCHRVSYTPSTIRDSLQLPSCLCRRLPIPSFNRFIYLLRFLPLQPQRRAATYLDSIHVA